MDAAPRSTDLFQQVPQPQYGMLKTLTMLTFIGCAIAFISILLTISNWGNYEQELADAQRLEEQVRDNKVASSLMKGSVEMIQKTHEHRYVMAATNTLFTVLCLIGAMRMRKLQKSGYLVYVIGELAPVVLTAVLLGFGFFSSIIMAVSAAFALLFVVLYSTQRKYLVHN